MRAYSHQPIYLAQLKKRDKENIITKQMEQSNLEYDLKVFQESLYMGNQTKRGVVSIRANAHVRKPMMECITSMDNSVNFVKQAQRGNMVVSSQQQRDSTAIFFKKCAFSKKHSQIKNLHQTQVSYKPNTKGNGLSARAALVDVKNVESQLVRNDDKILLVESYKIGVVDKIVSSSQCCSTEDLNGGGDFLRRTDIMKRGYQEKIEQLQLDSQSKEQKIRHLETLNNIHKQEKVNLLKRIDHIQQEMNQILRNDQLFNEEIKQNVSFHNDSCQTQILIQDGEVQTEQIEHIEQKQPPKEYIFEQQFSVQGLCMSAISEDPRNSSQYTPQDWILRAKALKNELQYQKSHASNLETQFKILLQNNQIQWRHKIQKLNKQLQVLNGRYQSKCLQVKEKESLINRLIANK